jgi:EAL domain-containing protein (putative c-di-GMP-specific phosphodiesterase class I)
VGVAVAPARESSFEQLLGQAETAMYSVKSGGKDAVRLFRAGMHSRAREQLGLAEEVSSALAAGQFWLLYQPVFRLSDQRLDGFQSLIRWNHPRRGLLRPAQFIALAEESGLIVPVGRWALTQALGHAGSWDHSDGPSRPLRVWVNVSAVQLEAPSLVDDVRDALAVAGVDPARVVLELPESSLVETTATGAATLRQLKQLGVQIAVERFGVDHASRVQLQSNQVDILKLDPALVRSGTEGGRGRDLLEAIMGVAGELCLDTVADGVDRPDQLDVLRALGCNLVQGHLLGRPLPIEAVQRMVLADPMMRPPESVARAAR